MRTFTKHYTRTELINYLTELLNTHEIFDITIYSDKKEYGLLTGMAFNSDAEFPEIVSFGMYEPENTIIGACAIKDTELLKLSLHAWINMLSDDIYIIPYNSTLHMV